MVERAKETGGKPLFELEEAIELIFSQVESLGEMEEIPLSNTLGRIVAQDIRSSVSVPPHDNSAMDGYALRSSRLFDDMALVLPVSQRIPAGSVGNPLEPETAARIFTGAPIPQNADAVVMQENCDIRDGMLHIFKLPKPGENIRHAGEDIAKGACILEKGTLLTPSHMALVASIGIADMSVMRRLKVAIISTGDELVTPGSQLPDGKIYDSNRYSLHGLLDQLGCDVIDMGQVEDNLGTTRQALKQASEKADLVLTSGGVSVGEEDHVKQALTELGELNLWKLNIKPGKPLAFGFLQGKPFVGLPGNPVSAYVTFLLVAAPLIRKMQGRAGTTSKPWPVAAGFEKTKIGKRREYIRVKAVANEAGKLVLQPYRHQGSAIMSGICWADGLACIPDGEAVREGDLLNFFSFESLLQ